jgi:hypothetical protein
MLQSRYIIVADLPDGKTKTLYQGSDAVEADKVFQQAYEAGKAEAVLKICHPQAQQVRFPARDAEEAKLRASAESDRAQAEAEAKRLKAQEKLEQSKALAAEAEKLKAEAEAHLNPKQD